jgi:alkanesulfonate monooxygenase SsuD/methylene tetrahydromethanopterin reductase-like flavin-dependent oxidoreductase (luciferase family)
VTLAGEVADGLIVNVVSPEYLADVLVERFRSAAREAGRDPEGLEVTALVTCVVADDPASGLEQARAMVAHRLRASPRMIDTQPAHRHPEIRAVHALMLSGDREAAAAAVSKELVQSLVVYGSSADLAAGLDRYLTAGATRVIAVAYPRSTEAVDRLERTLAPLVAKPAPI